MNVSIEKALQQLDGLILGKQAVLRQLLACILAGGHVLLEDVPGVGKTTLAHALAAVLGLDYRRVQFTNDMLPADLLGVNVYRPNEGRFEFHPGPVFHSFLLADEINRASPKLQSALLEAMEERQVTVDGVSLTVNWVKGCDFSINLIPHTLENTTLNRLQSGSKVNLEIDLIARYFDWPAPAGILGVGDDAALLELAGNLVGTVLGAREDKCRVVLSAVEHLHQHLPRADRSRRAHLRPGRQRRCLRPDRHRARPAHAGPVSGLAGPYLRGHVQ